MKILHVCYSDKHGGGAIGAYRLHTSMLSRNVDSRLLVIRRGSDDPTVERVPRHTRLLNLIGKYLSELILKLQSPVDKSYRSLNLLPIGIAGYINKFDADIIQLHWINHNTIGITEFKKINKPIVWKLPDMWAFSGTEHYPPDYNRLISGYTPENRPHGATGLDIDRFAWNLKKKHWENINMTIVSPSKWLANQARASNLFSHYPIHNIPNPVNLELYKPATDTAVTRAYFNLPLNKKIILFVSLTRLTDPRKGFSFLEECIREFSKSGNPENYKLVIMGRMIPIDQIGGIQVINLGYLRNEKEIALAYSAADVLAAPSYADNLPNTIKESMACGTPCIAFDTGGIPDMITHKENGFLSKVNDIDEFCKGLEWLLQGDIETISNAARAQAIQFHNPSIIVKKYLDLYEYVLSSSKIVR